EKSVPMQGLLSLPEARSAIMNVSSFCRRTRPMSVAPQTKTAGAGPACLNVNGCTFASEDGLQLCEDEAESECAGDDPKRIFSDEPGGLLLRAAEADARSCQCHRRTRRSRVPRN